jgi:hypothetical protein
MHVPSLAPFPSFLPAQIQIVVPAGRAVHACADLRGERVRWVMSKRNGDTEMKSSQSNKRERDATFHTRDDTKVEAKDAK